MRNKIIDWLGFMGGGLIGGAILIIFSEVIKFSYLGLFDPPSWATWFYPVAFIISFCLFGKHFKIKNLKIIVFLVAIVLFFLFYMTFEGSLFHNPLPFGINAYY